MKAELENLKSAMDKEATYKATMDIRMKRFKEDNADLFKAQEEIRTVITECKDALTIMGQERYLLDGNKKLPGGLGIRVMSRLEYEPKIAFDWAKSHKLCLKLDDSAFKKIAKTQDLDFVTKGERILVTFPKEIQVGD